MTQQERDEVATLRAFVEFGSYPLTAKAMGQTVPAVSSRLQRMRARYGVQNTIQLLHALQERGLCRVDWLV